MKCQCLLTKLLEQTQFSLASNYFLNVKCDTLAQKNILNSRGPASKRDALIRGKSRPAACAAVLKLPSFSSQTTRFWASPRNSSGSALSSARGLERSSTNYWSGSFSRGCWDGGGSHRHAANLPPSTTLEVPLGWGERDSGVRIKTKDLTKTS